MAGPPPVLGPADAIPAVGRRRDVVSAAALLTLAHLALLVCAVVPLRWGVLAAGLVAVAAELLPASAAGLVGWAFARTQLGTPLRSLLRALALTVLVAREGATGDAAVVALVLTALVVVHGLHLGAVQAIDHLRSPPLSARGLALRLPRVPTLPPALLRHPALSVAVADAVAVIGVTAGLDVDRPDVGLTALGVTALAVAAVLALVAPVACLVHVAALVRSKLRTRVPLEVERCLADLRPRVVVYYGDSALWQYQVEQWLPVLEALDRPVVVIVRDREVLRTLPPTRVPVVCAAPARTLMRLRIPDLRAALFVGNTATNLHMLRHPGIRSAFIGHGDSDKGASTNPFTRVYNQVWVAGPAGRARYGHAGVDIRDDAFVEVGRPQLPDLPRVPDARPALTVLYAPTFEGFGNQPATSLVKAGPELVRRLLAVPGLRVMYRPHPRTGHIDARTRAAHREIVELLRAAGAQPATTPPPRGTVQPDALSCATAAPADVDAWRAGRDRWQDEYWRDRPGHRLLTAPAPDLYDCLRRTDLLIADVSSVVSDFLAADRPYAIMDPTGAAPEEFRRRVRASAGGFVLTPDLAGLDDVLAAAARPDADPTAAARKRLRHDLVSCTGDEALRAFRVGIDRITGVGDSIPEPTP